MSHEPEAIEPCPVPPALPVARFADGPAPWHPTLRAFLSCNAGTVLYALSAVSVLYGIARLFGSLLVTDVGLREAVPCVLALGAYELAVLGVLLLIVTRWKVFEEAVSLAILVALFLVVDAVVLGLFANQDPQLSIRAGALALAFAVVRLWILCRWVRVPISRGMTAGVLLLFAWLFLSAPALAHHFKGGTASMDPWARGPWLWTWPALLAAGALVLCSLAFERAALQGRGTSSGPFLQTRPMSILVSLILLAGGMVQSYLLVYMWDMDRTAGDFLPMATVILFTAIEFVRRMEATNTTREVVLYSMPLGAWGLALLGGDIIAGAGSGPGLLLYPPVALFLTGLFVLALAWSRQRRDLLLVAGAYGLGALLTMGYVPGELASLNWRVVVLGLTAALFVFGILRKQAYLCWATMIGVGIGVAASPTVAQGLHGSAVHPAGVAIGIYALGTLLVDAILRKQLDPWIPRSAAALLILATLGICHNAPPWLDAVTAALALGTILTTYLRAKDPVLLGILGASMLYLLHLATAPLASWRFVLFGFVLLAAGAAASLRKGRRGAM